MTDQPKPDMRPVVVEPPGKRRINFPPAMEIHEEQRGKIPSAETHPTTMPHGINGWGNLPFTR